MKKIILCNLMLFATYLLNAQCWQQVTAAYNHSIAIKTDGTLWIWGQNYNGVLGAGTTSGNIQGITQLGTANNWLKVDTEKEHTLAIKTDGTLWAWGANTNGQLGDGTTTNRNTPVQIGTDNHWIKVSAGVSHSFGIKTDGTLWCWGSGGPTTNGSGSNILSPVQIGTANNWADISSKFYHTLALKTDGSLWSWGNNLYGELGDGSTSNHVTPTQVGTAAWSKIATGQYYTIAIKSDNTLWGWGANNGGQLGNGTQSTTGIMTPYEISNDNWIDAAASTYSTVAIKANGTLWAWGNNTTYQLGDGTTTTRTTPVLIGTDTDWQSVSIGPDFSLAIKNINTLYGWGANGTSQLALPNNGGFFTRNIPTFISCCNTALPTAFSQTFYGPTTLANVVATGTNVKWYATATGGNALPLTTVINGTGTYYATQTINGCESDRLAVLLIVNGTSTNTSCWLTVSGGENFTIAIKTDGTLWGWGYNSFGQLGRGDFIDVYTPSQIGTDSDWASISAGGGFVLALKTNGTLWSWGVNSSGQLGDGSLANRNYPMQVGTNTDWIKIAAGGAHSLAIKANGVLYGWGENSYYYELGLGVGNNTDKSVPTLINIGPWKDIVASWSHSLALKTNGTLWAWGDNEFGISGTGSSNVNIAVPTQVGNAIYKYIAASRYNSFALRTDGSIWASGRYVNGTDTGTLSAVFEAQGTYGCESISVQDDGTYYAVKNDALYHGSMYYLAAGTSGNFSMVGGPYLAQNVYSGTMHTLVLAVDGKLYGTGSNNVGQLGNGTTTSNVPGILTPVNMNCSSCTTAAPVIANQSFCNSATVADLPTTGNNIKWYANATDTNPLSASTVLTTGTYYASQTYGCESTKVAVQVTINVPTPPTASNQTFCSSATIADLSAVGSSIKWYNSNTGTTPLDASISVTNGVYYASQTIDGCESTRTSVAVTINVTPLPIAIAQTFCLTATVADLVATGTNIKWYSDVAAITPLSSGLTLTTGTYYVTQTLNNCESNKKPVNITLVNNVDVSTSVNGNIISSNQNGALYQWNNCATGPINGATGQIYNAVESGSYSVTVTIGSCSATSTCVSIPNLDIPQQSVSDNLLLYPIPASDNIKISGDLLVQNIFIYDVTGRLADRIFNPGNTINISNLKPGVYLFVITTEKGTKTEKVIKNSK